MWWFFLKKTFWNVLEVKKTLSIFASAFDKFLGTSHNCLEHSSLKFFHYWKEKYKRDSCLLFILFCTWARKGKKVFLHLRQLKYSILHLIQDFIISHRAKETIYYIFYNEEFDPGSGWTLATGLTHASRGAACRKLAFCDGDRRTGA